MSRFSRRTPAGRAGRIRSLFFWGAALAALAPLVANCGSSSNGDDDDGPGLGADPCTTVYRGKCGVACDDRSPCGAGMFCSNGACTAQCTAETGCSGGLTCSAQGRCVGTGSGSGGSGGSGLPGGSGSGTGGSGQAGSGTSGGGNCPDVSAKFQPIIPAIMLVADRSASMQCPISSPAEVVGDCPGQADPNSPSSRWRTFKDALLPFIGQQQEKALFGVAFYPNSGNQCDVDVNPAVTLLAGAQDEIQTAYDGTTPEGSTPTGPAIDAAVAQINAANGLPPNTPKFIVLASDGSPTCGGNAQQTAVDAVGRAFDAGIHTFVIAIGQLFEANAAKKAQFQAMADAGVGVGKPGVPIQPGDGPLYPVTDTASLATALTTIINGVRPCSFDLDVALKKPNEDGPKGVVTIDNQPVPFNTPDGWHLVDQDTIEFTGQACASIRGGATDVKATFPCGVETTPAPPPPDPPR